MKTLTKCYQCETVFSHLPIEGNISMSNENRHGTTCSYQELKKFCSPECMKQANATPAYQNAPAKGAS